MFSTIAIAPVRGLVLAGLSILGLVAVLAHALVLLLTISVGLAMLMPWAIGLGRRVTGARRKLAARWDGVYIPWPYSPAPEPPEPDEEGLYLYEEHLYNSPRTPMLYRKVDWMLDDRATWRDLAWLLLNASIGNVLALAPAALIIYGALTLPWGGLLIMLGFLLGPMFLRLHTAGSRVLLGLPLRTGPRAMSKRFTKWGYSFGLFALSLNSVFMLIVFPRAWKVANTRRKLASEWSGVPVAQSTATRTTWRDLRFFALDPIVGVLTTVVPFVLLLYAGWGLAVPQTWRWFVPPTEPDWAFGWYGQFAGSDWLAIPAAVGLSAVALWITPPLIRLNGQWVRTMLAPADDLTQRVLELAKTRADATDAAAAELRRIEQDLHDGAQARLVAMGLGLGALEHLIDQDPDRAKQVLSKVRSNSAQALAELRDLVRGIHPPVLADRGLGDAVRALALDTPLPVKVQVDLPRRLDPPIETAAYFAISEALTNVSKHAEAASVGVDVRLVEDTLELTVRDDGRGGADVSRGTGLRGVARRLSAFDGVMTVHSPVGGPTTIRMTLRVSAG
ncbi:histidine kinase [Kibdelosporangium philippinense]|uniref:histidine kinase n=1 Tax=Kibdelosporangium philippinense TaxID=211113 RepID=A0ABS8Z1A8_9PSEU|nr:histidine kinase [Kibdelosporangium philippinense]MCE7001709.1 histidine kinase [Kibdelosporangium philippinense]